MKKSINILFFTLMLAVFSACINDNEPIMAKAVRKRLRDSILSPFFHSYIFAMYKNEALWI